MMKNFRKIILREQFPIVIFRGDWTVSAESRRLFFTVPDQKRAAPPVWRRNSIKMATVMRRHLPEEFKAGKRLD